MSTCVRNGTTYKRHHWKADGKCEQCGAWRLERVLAVIGSPEAAQPPNTNQGELQMADEIREETAADMQTSELNNVVDAPAEPVTDATEPVIEQINTEAAPLEVEAAVQRPVVEVLNSDGATS